MSGPTDVDPQALRLLDETGWLWSDAHRAFVESRDPERETTEQYRDRGPKRIGHGELRDHGLAGHAPTTAMQSGIRWLRERLSASR